MLSLLRRSLHLQRDRGDVAAFEVASLLADGKTFTQISQKIGVSSTTITRVNKCLCYGADGYKLLFDRAKEEK